MRRLILIGAFVAVLVPGAAIAQTVVGTPHDLTTFLVGSEDVCVFCHTPHGGSTDGPLWNHTQSTHSGSYGFYSSNTMNATAGTFDANDPNPSANCMTCHDGTVGVGNLYNEPNGATANNLENVTMGSAPLTNANANLGVTLSNDHPINFVYQNSIDNGDNELNAFSAVSAVLPFFGPSNDQLHCATCHDPHDNTNGQFLIVNNDNSNLCTQCHTK